MPLCTQVTTAQPAMLALAPQLTLDDDLDQPGPALPISRAPRATARGGLQPTQAGYGTQAGAPRLTAAGGLGAVDGELAGVGTASASAPGVAAFNAVGLLGASTDAASAPWYMSCLLLQVGRVCVQEGDIAFLPTVSSMLPGTRR